MLSNHSELKPSVIWVLSGVTLQHQEIEEMKMLATKGKRSKGNAMVTCMLMTPQCRIKWRQVRRNWGSSRSFPSSTNCKQLRLPRSAGKRPFHPAGLATIENRFSITANKQLNYTVRKWKPDSSWNQMHRTWDGCAQKVDHRKVTLFVDLKAQSDVVWPHQQSTGKATTGWIFIATI